MQQWHKFRALTAGERTLLLQATVLLPTLNLALHLLGLRRLQRILVWQTSLHAPADQPAHAEKIGQQATALAQLVAIAAHYGPYRATCLRRSLLLWWWLQPRGIAGELRIGVHETGAQFTAHAWVEVGGVVINDRDDVGKRFVAFDSFRLKSVIAGRL